MQNRNDGVFVISLDAVDLNMLPIYNERPDKVSPLWTRSNLQMRNNDYYQFEIKCKDCEGSDEDKPPKHEYEHKFCHICDIDVPKTFWNDHMKSVKHKSNVKIADTAILRMKKYLNETEHESNDELDPSAHFCPTCVTVIDCKDRNVHEKSLSHRNAQIVEKLFTDFLILYNFNESNTNDTANEKQISNLNDVETEISHNLVGNKDKKRNETANAKLIWDINTDEALNYKDNPKDKKRNETANAKLIWDINTDEALNYKDNPIDKVTPNKDKSNINVYIDLLNKHYNDNKRKFKVINNLIEIETNDGSIVKVTDKHFHGFNVTSKKNLYCLMCKLCCKEKKSDKHIFSIRHLTNVSAPLINKHCIRYIQDQYYHCVICNTIAENSELHLLRNENHEKLLKIALMYDQSQSPASNNMSKEANIHEDTPIFDKVNVIQQSANIKIPSYAEKVQIYKKITPQNNNMNATSEEANSETITKENAYQKQTVSLNEENNRTNTPSISSSVKAGAVEKADMLPENKSFPVLFNESISKENLSRHKLRPQHILKSTSDTLYLMSEIDNEYLLCKVCEVCIKNNVESVRKHVLDEGHKLKYETLLLYNTLSKVDQNKFYCDLCEEYVLIKNEIIHIDSTKHRYKCNTTEVVTLSHNEKDNIEDDKENHEDEQENHEADNGKTVFEFYQCTVCDVKVPNRTNNLQEHFNGRVHLRNLEKCSVESTNETEDRVEKYHYHMEVSDFPNCLKCIICDVTILCIADSVTQHINDLKHARNYEILLENNFLVNEADNVYCKLCGVFVGLKCELLHVRGRKHKKNIEKHYQSINAQKINEIDNVNVETETRCQSEALIRAADGKNIPAEMIIFLKEIDNDSVECIVCKVNIPFTEYNVRTHMNGTRHAKNQKSGSTNDVNKGINDKL